MDKKHPDTEAGAKAALQDAANRSTFARLRNLEWRPDPACVGVWGVYRQEDRYDHGLLVRPELLAIVYLAGYGGRTLNDFECAE